VVFTGSHPPQIIHKGDFCERTIAKTTKEFNLSVLHRGVPAFFLLFAVRLQQKIFVRYAGNRPGRYAFFINHGIGKRKRRCVGNRRGGDIVFRCGIGKDKKQYAGNRPGRYGLVFEPLFVQGQSG
jgi:hypothetical protein